MARLTSQSICYDQLSVVAKGEGITYKLPASRMIMPGAGGKTGNVGVVIRDEREPASGMPFIAAFFCTRRNLMS